MATATVQRSTELARPFEAERAVLSRLRPGLVGLALSAAGIASVLLQLHPSAQLALTFAGFVVALFGSLRVNQLANRTMTLIAGGAHAMVVSLFTSDPLLSAAVFVLAFGSLQHETLVRLLGYHVEWLSSVSALVATALVLATWPLRLEALAVAPIGLLGLTWASIMTRAAISLSSTPVTSRVRVGDLFPDFELPLRTDPSRTFRLSSLRGRHVLLAFLIGDWCPVCQVQMRVYRKEAPRLASEGVALVVISPTEGDSPVQRASDISSDIIFLQDKRHVVAQQVGWALRTTNSGVAAPLPVSFLIDPQGRLQYATSSDDVLAFFDPRRVPEVLMKLKAGVQ